MAEKDNTGLILGLSLAAAAGLILVGSQTETVKTFVRDTVSDATNNYRINLLHPKVRQPFRNFVNDAENQGIKLLVTSTLRSFPEQADLYAIGSCPCCGCNIGRTKPGSIVTNAKPGDSFHNYGLAGDVVEIKDGQLIGCVICKQCGSIAYKKDYPYARWQQIGSIAKKHGFEWGGDWKGFKDLPHVQMPLGKTVQQLLALYNSGMRIGDYPIL